MRSRRGRNIDPWPFKTSYSQLTLKSVSLCGISRAFTSCWSQVPIINGAWSVLTSTRPCCNDLEISNTNTKSIEFDF